MFLKLRVSLNIGDLFLNVDLVYIEKELRFDRAIQSIIYRIMQYYVLKT